MNPIQLLERKLVQTAQQEGIHSFVASSCVFKEDKILLICRSEDDFWGGHWEFPGGGVDAGEGLIVALSRELREETGLMLTTVSGLVSSFDLNVKEQPGRQFCFRIGIESECQVILTEHSAYEWLTVAEALARPCTPATKEALRVLVAL